MSSNGFHTTTSDITAGELAHIIFDIGSQNSHAIPTVSKPDAPDVEEAAFPGVSANQDWMANTTATLKFDQRAVLYGGKNETTHQPIILGFSYK